MSSFVGYNIMDDSANDPQRGGSWEDLYKHQDIVQSRYNLVYKLGSAIQLLQRYPNQRVFLRYWPDGDSHLRYSPEEWIERRRGDFNILKNLGLHTRCYFVTVNEPGVGSPADVIKLVEWHTNLDISGRTRVGVRKGVMELAEDIGMRLGVMHLATGSWQPHYAYYMRPVLWKCSKNQESFLFCTHSYFCVVPSSGAPVRSTGPLPYFDTDPRLWPKGQVGRWHCGREQFLWDECLTLDISGGQILPFPKIVITEGGNDRLDEGGVGWMKTWLDSLGTHIRAWTTCFPVWDRLLKPIWKEITGQDYTHERAYWYMAKYVRDVVFAGTYRGVPKNVDGYLFFGWWNSGVVGSADDWGPFRVDTAREFRQLHEAEMQSIPTPTPVPVPVPVPPPGGTVIPTPLPKELGPAMSADLQTTTWINLRTGTSTKHVVLIGVVGNARVRVYPDTKRIENGYSWYVVDHAQFRGWMAMVSKSFEVQFKAVSVKYQVIVDLENTAALENLLTHALFDLSYTKI